MSHPTNGTTSPPLTSAAVATVLGELVHLAKEIHEATGIGWFEALNEAAAQLVRLSYDIEKDVRYHIVEGNDGASDLM